MIWQPTQRSSQEVAQRFVPCMTIRARILWKRIGFLTIAGINATIISHFYKRLNRYMDDRYAWNKEAYSMGLKDFIRGLKTGKPNSLNYTRRSYEKSTCPVCGQVCYNKEDLQLHLKYNHPDVASAKPA
jgi:hypothetical protein